MRSVEIGAHEAIEEFVVAIGELLFECLGASCEPIDKGLSNLLDLVVSLLDFLAITDLDGPCLSRGGIDDLLALVDVGNGVVQGVLQQV